MSTESAYDWKVKYETQRQLYDAAIEIATKYQHELEAAQLHIARLDSIIMQLQAQLMLRDYQRQAVDMLTGAFTQPAAQPQFTQDEIARMLRLCHPDKHGNSEAANDITRKLLNLRGR